MDKKETTVTQCLSTPVRDEPGSLVTENGGHSLLPSPLAPIPHSKAQTRALAHPRRRTREICGDYHSKKMFSRTSATSGRRHRGGAEAEETRGETPVARRGGCRHKIIRFQGEERETQHCEAALRSGKSFLCNSKEHVVSDTSNGRTCRGSRNFLRSCVLYTGGALSSGSKTEAGINPSQSQAAERPLHVVK